MNIVSNSSPLIFLAKIGRIDLLTKLFDKIYIPQAVYGETVIVDKNDDVSQFINEKIVEGKIEIIQVQNEVAIRGLLGRLHHGEVEVIIGANEAQINSVILDDLYARNKAKQYNLAVIGTLGILLLAFKQGLISDLQLEVQKLMNVGFRISDTIIQKIMLEIEASS